MKNEIPHSFIQRYFKQRKQIIPPQYYAAFIIPYYKPYLHKMKIRFEIVCIKVHRQIATMMKEPPPERIFYTGPEIHVKLEDYSKCNVPWQIIGHEYHGGHQDIIIKHVRKYLISPKYRKEYHAKFKKYKRKKK